MNTHSGTLQRRLAASLCCLVGAGGAVWNSSALTLNDGNASVDINPDSQAGMHNWFVDGQDHLTQQWLWYRVGNTAESSIDTLPSQLLQSTASSASYLFNGSGFELEVRYSLTGGSAGSGTSDVSEQFILRNTSGSPLTVTLFLYADFDLNGTSGGDTVTSVAWKPIPFSNPGYDRATQVDGFTSQTTTISYFADRAEAQFFAITLNKLNDGVANSLVNAGASFGPTVSGDLTYAFQWDIPMIAGGSQIIGVDKLIVVPEPTTMSLALVALAGFLARRRS
jgi:hypothetical protein